MTTELLEKALESVGGAEEFKRKREEFRRDLAFIEENREKLFREYINSWVAVYNSEVVAHGKNYGNVLSQLEKNNMPVGQIPIRYLSKHKIFALYLRL
jgi:ribosomal protein L20